MSVDNLWRCMSNPKKTRSEQKREDILNAAMTAFREQGVKSTSMDKLAELAGVSKRTVYNHFATKEDLVLSLLAEMWQQFMLRSDLRYDPNITPRVQLRELIEAEVNMLCDDDFIALARVAMGHFFYHPDAMRRELDKMNAQETVLERWLKAAKADGKLNADDVQYAADQLRSLLKGALFWPRVMCDDVCPKLPERNKLIDETLMMFSCRYLSAE